MSVFDLFRGFFGVPGGRHHDQRDPFFDFMTHDDDEDDYEDDFHYDGYRGDQQDPFDSAWRFGFSFGPDGMRIQDPPMFGHILREMEEIFSQMGHWDRQHDFGVPSVMPPPPPSQDRVQKGGGSSGNPLRDFMLKSPNQDRPGPQPGPSRESRHDGFPFSKFHDIWRQGPTKAPEGERKEDGDLDSAVSSAGLDQILSPPAGQPRIQSFFQSVTVSKVVKPDGTVEERRTVRDGQGNEKTTVTHSGGPGDLEGPDNQSGPLLPRGPSPFGDMRDDGSLFSNFFKGFK